MTGGGPCPSSAFAAVHVAIRGGEQRLEVCGRVGGVGDADGCGDDAIALGDNGGIEQRLAGALLDTGLGWGVRHVEHQRELVSAEAYRCVVGSERVSQPVGHFLEHGVAGEVPAFVVYGLETVEVDHGDDELASVTFELVQGGAVPLLERSPVADTGEVVGCDQLSQVLLEDLPVDPVADDAVEHALAEIGGPEEV